MARINAGLIVWALAAVAVASNLAIALLHPSGLFWDEQFYNYAATLILHGQSCPTISLTVGPSTVPVATSCNYEHPPLVKLMVAVTVYVLTPLRDASASGSLPSVVASLLSYRLVQLVMGALCLPLLYATAYGISKDRRLALVAAVLLFLEPLFAFFSHLDYLDIPMIFFALCAYAVYFGDRTVPRINRFAVTGIFLALSVLSKETGVVFVIPLIVYHLLFRQAGWRQKSKELLTVVGIEALASVVGLQLYDTLARTPFPFFFDQIAYMVRYSDFLAGPHLCSPIGSVPWYNFLTYDYWMLGVSYNPVLLWFVLVWIPVGGYMLWKGRRQLDGANRLFVLATGLFVVTFFQNELLCFSGRILWVWYFLPIVPSLALGGAYLLTRKQIPLWIRLLSGALIVAGYFAAYLIGPGLLMYD